jgi:hypothetical protein
MQVYARSKYRFMRPGAKLFEKAGVDASQILGKQVEFREAFFELEPEQFQDAPDWIKEDQMFQWALRDGDIKMVQPGQDTSIPPAPEPTHTHTPLTAETRSAVESARPKRKES